MTNTATMFAMFPIRRFREQALPAILASIASARTPRRPRTVKRTRPSSQWKLKL